jgi:hypothetical protein
VTSVLDGIDLVNAACERASMPAMSSWWREKLGDFYDTTIRESAWRVGRRGGKSSSLCRVAVAEALYGEHYVAPGDTPVVALIAQDRKRAAELLVTLGAILNACEVEHKSTADKIACKDLRVEFRVFTATIAGVSGATCICVICDEVSKWRDADTGANPATEVLASVRPTMATIPRARMFLSSSPLGSLDAHAKAVDRGNTASQRVYVAPTWVAHPELTEEWTHSLEPNESYWSREYAAIPTEGDALSMLASAWLDAAERDGELPYERGHYYVGAMDPGYSRNPWTFVLATRRWACGKLKNAIVVAREWKGSSRAPNDPEAVMGEITEICQRYQAVGVYTDQYEAHALKSIAVRKGLLLSVGERGAGDRLGRYEAMATLLANGEVELPKSDVIRADLLSIRQKITPNGFTIDLPETSDGRHADYAPSIALALSKCTADPVMGAPRISDEEKSRLRLDSEYAKSQVKPDPWERPIDESPRRTSNATSVTRRLD